MARSGSLSESDSEDSSLSDSELQEAFARGALKPGLNVVLEERPKRRNDVAGLRHCLAEFKQQLAWVERLDVTSGQVADPTPQNASDKDAVDAENDFQREMSFVLWFSVIVDCVFLSWVIRQKLKSKQEAMERSEKAKQLRAMRKYGKKVQTEILQRRQKEKKNMLNAVKKYQKGLSDKLDFLDEEQTSSQGNTKGGASQRMKKGPNAKRRYKNQKFGFGGKKKGSKWNTKESFNDVSSFRSKVAHNKGPGKAGKGGKKALNKRPGKRARQKMKSRAR
ncbi:Ebna1bp2 [Columba livia]|nr:Ebna1bp2 [Columba livia]